LPHPIASRASAKAANSYTFLAAGQHMRLKYHLSIINNERNADFWADANYGFSGAIDDVGEYVAHLQPGLSCVCATRRRPQTLTTREEESFIRLLISRGGMDRTGSLIYPADCLYNLAISTSSTIYIVTHHGQSAIHFEWHLHVNQQFCD
jgi:hypothetical protein